MFKLFNKGRNENQDVLFKDSNLTFEDLLATPTSSTDAGRAPGTEIEYHPDLVSILNRQHQDIKNILADVVIAANKSKYKAVKKHLKFLSKTLRDHVIKESILLYVYLKNMSQGEKELQKYVTDSHKEKKILSHVVFSNINEWLDTEEFVMGHNFLEKFYKMVSAITIQFDYDSEVVYPLYQQASKIKFKQTNKLATAVN